MTMTRDKIEELKQRISLYACAQVAGSEDEAERVFAQIESLLALAERALEPQGQALPVPEDADALQSRFRKTVFDQGFAIMNKLMSALTVEEKLRDAEDVKSVISEAMNMAGELTLAARACGYEPSPMRVEHSWYHGYGMNKKVVMEPWKPVRAEHVRILDAQSRASKLALPAGPVPEGLVLVPMHLNAEMRDVLSEEDWTWEDLLVAANAVTEEQYYAIQSGDGESPAVAQPVADERAEYERMLRAGYQHDNVRRQERGLASSDELTQEQEREIAERVALKFPSDAPAPREPIAFSCAKRAAYPTSWTMTCDKHCGDGAKCLRAAPLETAARAALCQPAEEGGKS